MKKIMTLFAAAAIVGAAWAHSQHQVMPINRTAPQQQEVSVQPDFEAAAQMAPAQTMTTGKVAAKNFNAKQFSKVPTAVRRASFELAPEAGYLNPEGTWFCGIDKQGTYLWVNYITVLGSWLNGYDAWVWDNIADEATTYEYQNAFGLAYPQYKDMGNTVDAQNNWVDSLPALYKANLNSYFSYRLPLQIVENGVGKDSFALAVPADNRLDTVIDKVMTLAGIHNPMDDEGFWPMTQAKFFDEQYGFGMNFIWTTNKTAKTWEYVLGSTAVHDTIKGSLGQDSAVTYQPSGFVQMFEKPMSPMYVHDITLAIGACQATAAGLNYGTPTFDSLVLMITDTAMMPLYATYATIKDTTNMLYIDGAMVNFKIETEDAFGEKTIGMTIDQPFMVWVYGLNRPGNEFGIYTDLNTLTGSSTFVIDAQGGKFTQYYPGNPFLMFNGIMNTLEDGSKAMGYEAMSDTINVTIEEESGEWIALYADGDMQNYLPVIAAVDLLYDTLTSEYNYDIEAPDWAELDMELYDTYWDDYGVYFLYIYGNAEDQTAGTPQIGEEIVLSQYGKKIVYRIVGVPTALNEIKYINDGKRYDVLGKEVDENYKGIVIKNGKKFLQ